MATHLGRGDIFCDARNENLLLCMQMKKNWKSVSIWNTVYNTAEIGFSAF